MTYTPRGKCKSFLFWTFHRMGPWRDHSWGYVDYRHCVNGDHTQWRDCPGLFRGCLGNNKGHDR